MAIFEQLKTAVILLPVAMLIALGVMLTVSSGSLSTGHATITHRSVFANFMRTLVRVGLCMVLLLALQELVGFRHS